MSTPAASTPHNHLDAILRAVAGLVSSPDQPHDPNRSTAHRRLHRRHRRVIKPALNRSTIARR